MRIHRQTFLLTIAMILFAGPLLYAQKATGGFHVTLDDGLTKNFEFNARVDPDGTGSGQLTFNGSVEFSGTDGDDNEGKPSTVDVFMKVDFDCVQIRENLAAMSGVVRDARPDNLIGKRVLLAVQDGGEGANATDAFTWGMYTPRPTTWFPTDADIRDDDGWKLTWFASDSEREDDVPVQISRSNDVDCRSFSFANYTFIDLPQGSGNVQVHK